MICELSLFSSLPSRPSRLRGSFKKNLVHNPLRIAKAVLKKVMYALCPRRPMPTEAYALCP